MAQSNAFKFANNILTNGGFDAADLVGAAGGSSDYVLLASTTASTSASVSFDGYFTSTYKNYFFIYSGVRGDADAYLRIRYRKSNSDVTTSNYNYINASGRYVDSAGADSAINWYEWGGTHFLPCGSGQQSDVNSEITNNGHFTLFDPLSVNTYKIIYGFSQFTNAVGTMIVGGSYTGYHGANADALSGVTFSLNTGNIAIGTFKLYGLK
jgi:hypothetical protein